jgi:hypothetical protein
MLFLLCGIAQIAYAQEPANKNWDAPKIKGVRQLPYPTYNGFPFLTDNWCLGKLEFTTGEVVDSLFLRYSSFKDELVYYNKTIASQINIDKASLKGFEFTDTNGVNRIFRKLYIDNFMKSYRFFEVLYDGPTPILAYRKVNLISTSPYQSNTGVLKNMEYAREYQLYFYSAEKGFANIKTSRASFLLKFDKAVQKPIKKLLRKNKIRIENEDSLIQAWRIVEKEGYKILF